MSKASYAVVAVLPGRYNDYIDYWTKEVKVNSLGEQLHSGMLAITEVVSAANKGEAERQVQKKYPKHTIDSAATKKLG
jgi:hypothetical protein